ncbi:cobalamin biosynthesis protein [Caloramator sp. E03]|uniref:adenosylcobinamide-phosphate synthase CbiB n=1 Tax=Caloramator sp. E03 TaxID=2576307 RepID=UPI0011102BBC|nr:adenosylcobinamide-phosphate synthase CbiB [Caloramator sp. E03]QCX32645.1 cobalamin biosynthesis protein [Caloramator sp. E03]
MVDLFIASIIDIIIGDPYFFPHPVKLMGRIISFEEKLARRLLKDEKGLKIGGFFIVFINILLSFFIPFTILKFLKPYKILYHTVNAYFIYTCIAARCLHDEAFKIYKAFNVSLDEARYRLSFIVGRQTSHLDEGEIVRATVETVAENTSDGVIAPLIYIMIGGAPLGMMYKMINTMDSMLGYMNEKYRYIGFFPAKCDDVFNFIPARVTGALMNLSSIFRYDVKNGFKIMIRDRKNHKSPNCAYPEGAVAGLLNVQLGGDNIYFGELVKKPKIGNRIRELSREDIKKTVEIMYRTEILLLILYLIIKGVLLWFTVGIF